MKKMRFGVSVVACLLLVSNTFAKPKTAHRRGVDPIHPTLLYTIPAQSTVGHSYTAAYRLNNNLSNPVPLRIQLKFTGSAFSVSSGCDTTLGAKGQANDSCLLQVQYRPHSAGVKSAQITMIYWNDVVPITPALVSTASGQETTGSVKGYVTAALPSVAYVGNTYPVAFTYINTSATAVTPTIPPTVTGSGVGFFTQDTNTCNIPLAAYTGQCSITGTFTPAGSFPGAGSPFTLSTTYTYVNGSSISIPLSTTTIVQDNPGTCQVVGVAELPLPAQNYIYADSVVKFVFTNHCSTSTTLGQVNITSNIPGTIITRGTDGCSAQSLAATAPNNTCAVYASVVPNSVTPELNVTAQVSYNSGAATATTNTSESVVTPSNQATTHTVQFINQCNFDTWYEFTNGATAGKSPDPTVDTSFFGYQVQKQILTVPPVPKILAVTEYVNGAIYARTGCDPTSVTGFCETASCPVISGTMTCQPTVQPTNPVTIFELNMNTPGTYDGVYDVSMVNGFNVPGQVQSMAPRSTTSAAGSSAYPFNCGQSGGALIQPAVIAPTPTGLGACPWTFSPPNTGSPELTENYVWVAPGTPQNCPTVLCTGTDVCGMAFTSSDAAGGNAPITRSCGAFLGYWSLADYAGYPLGGQWGTPNLYSEFSMPTLLTLPTNDYGQVPFTPPPPQTDATYASMFMCTRTTTNALMSGYTPLTAPPPVPSPLVCGCYDWPNTAQAAPCVQTNSFWNTLVLPQITWLKSACPTAYSYQYDDTSSSFVCNLAGQQTSYQITFCPGGKTGAPT